MKKGILGVLVGVGVTIVSIPFLLIALWIGTEIFGIFANHAATDNQTKNLRNVIEQQIDDAKIIDEYSETGNTSGTGNHVDCLSRITFSSEKNEETVSKTLEENFEYWDLKFENGIYIVTLNTSAPFPDKSRGTEAG